jgi:putative ABC transport system ATP-binding protein
MKANLPPVAVHDVHKTYRRGGIATPVLQGVNLVVGHGRCAVLTGPSGSGKSTLLSILGTMLSPDQGSVRIAGHDLGRLDAAARTRLRRELIGFVFQRFELLRGLSALDNVAVPLALRRMPQRAAQKRAAEALAAVGLADKLHSHPRHLSAGQCQRVALARALAGEPELILADEPTASLDEQHGLELMGLLRRLTAEQGRTAVIVTHDPRILRFADVVYRLAHGRLETAERPRARLISAAEEVLT